MTSSSKSKEPRAIRRVKERVGRLLSPAQSDPNPGRLYEFTNKPGPAFITEGGPYPVIHGHVGQVEAWNSPERFILLLAGTRGGKTMFGPWWLLREMSDRGPGEYLVCAPTYPLLKKGAYKAIRRVFVVLLQLGHIVGGAQGEFTFTPEGFARLWPGRRYDPDAKIVFGHAGNPDSLEAAEYKAAWLDECGQKGFKADSWEAIQRRLAIDKGRALLTTTPYVVQHWIKEFVYDPWKRRGTGAEQVGDAACRVVSFASNMNPAFPMEEWERAEAVLPKWKFDLFYRGILTRPAGLIYDAFDDSMIWPPYDPPPMARIFVGIDFGAPNFAATFFAEELLHGPPRKSGPRYIAWAEYRPQENHTAKEHVANMRAILNGRKVVQCVGGSFSEEQPRLELIAANWAIQRPDQSDIETGIDRVYGCMRDNRFAVTRDCPRLLAELASYSRPVDEAGNVLNDIENQHEAHGLDSVRYIIGTIERRGMGTFAVSIRTR